MESNTKTARPYAIAAFQQAQEEGDTGRWSDMLSLLATVAADPTMAGLVANPKVKRQQLAELIIDVCGDVLSETGRNFVRILAENRRLNIIREIAAAYEMERSRAERRSDVRVTSAFELSPAEQNAITVAMTKRFATKVDLSVEVDPALIGGIVIRSGDTVIDGSLRGQLAKLAQSVA
jgi:F-type H+-transporting ATPase subunit delta